MKAKDIPIPERWPPLSRQAMLHATSLAHFSIICAWSRASDSSLVNVRLKAKLDKLQTQLAQRNNHSPPLEPLKLLHSSVVPEMELHISYLEGRKHLPVIELKKVA